MGYIDSAYVLSFCVASLYLYLEFICLFFRNGAHYKCSDFEENTFSLKIMRIFFHATYALSEIKNESWQTVKSEQGYTEVLRKLYIEVRKILHEVKMIKFF